MKYELTLDFECECGRKHKLRLGREGLERIVEAVDGHMYKTLSRSTPTNAIGGPQTGRGVR